MISYEQALRAVLDKAQPLSARQVDITDACGFVLAGELVADCDWPRFENSAVDGFAVRRADLHEATDHNPRTLRLAATIAAGADPAPLGELPGGCTWRILTGAPVPGSVEAVVMKEHAEVAGETVVFRRCPKPGENIRRRGGEFRCGDPLLPDGTRVTPAVIGLLAALGRTTCRVYGRPVVHLVCTGDELVPPGAPLGPGQIYDSNAQALAAALRPLAAEVRVTSRVPDDPGRLEAAAAAALEAADVVITVGGVSVGEFDFVKIVLARLGVEQVFWSVAIKPGKPNYFGTRGRTLVFGLPGNPVSALCSLHQLVRPALRRLSGMNPPVHEAGPRAYGGLAAILDQPLHQRPGRLDFVRGRLRRGDGAWHVVPVRGQGSDMIAGLAAADCLIHCPAEAEHLEPGTLVWVEPLEW